MELRETKELMEEGRFYEALHTIEVLEKNNSLTSDEQLSILLFKCTCLNRLRFKENILKFAEKAFQDSQKLGKSLQMVDALIEKAETLSWLMKLDKALDIVGKGEALLKNIIPESLKELKMREASLSFAKGRIYMNKYDYDRGLKHFKKSLLLQEELDIKQEIARTLTFIGRLYFYAGDFDIAIEYSQRGLTVAKEGRSKHYILDASCLLGTIYCNNGEINRALEYGEQGLILANEINCKYLAIRSYDSIAMCYNTKGFFDRAIEFNEQQMKVAQEINNKRDIIDALNHIGSAYRNKGDLDKALQYMEKSLALYDDNVEREVLGIPVIDYILGNLFELFLNRGDFEQARLYYQRFELLATTGKRHEYANQLYKAQLLKTSRRAYSRGKSEKILKQLVDGEIVDIELTYIAFINLCDLLLFELNVTNDFEVLDELQSYLNRLLDIIEKNRSYTFLAESHLLQARVSLITFDIKEARRFLTQAQQISERFGLKQLATRISNEHEELVKQLDIWEKLKKSDAPLTERLKLARIEDQMEEILRNRMLLTTRISEEQISIHTERKVCLVCKGDVERFNVFICPKCNAIYCENCARALTDLENICWSCNIPIDPSKAMKPYDKDKGIIDLSKADIKTPKK